MKTTKKSLFSQSLKFGDGSRGTTIESNTSNSLLGDRYQREKLIREGVWVMHKAYWDCTFGKMSREDLSMKVTVKHFSLKEVKVTAMIVPGEGRLGDERECSSCRWQEVQRPWGRTALGMFDKKQGSSCAGVGRWKMNIVGDGGKEATEPKRAK